MSKPHQAVFVGYRRELSAAHARAIFLDLHGQGFDVFMEVPDADTSVPSRYIMNQIAARPHFVLVVAPGTFDDCDESNDTLGRAVTYALETERHIVVVQTGDFVSFPKQFEVLGRYETLVFDYRQPEQVLNTLCEQLNGVVEMPPPVAPLPDEHAPMPFIDELVTSSWPTAIELGTEYYFARAHARHQQGDLEGAIEDYSAAVDLDPEHHKAFYNRGLAHYDNRSLSLAIKDFGEAIRLKPDYVKARYNRGLAYFDKQDLASAIADFNETLRLEPDLAAAYNNRGLAHRALNRLDRAEQDFTAAMEFDPDSVLAYFNRGNVRQLMGDVYNALADYQHYLKMGGGELNHNRIEVEALISALQLSLQPIDERIRVVKRASQGASVFLGLMFLLLVLTGGSAVTLVVVLLAVIAAASVYVVVTTQLDLPGIDHVRRLLGLSYASATLPSPRLATTSPFRSGEDLARLASSSVAGAPVSETTEPVMAVTTPHHTATSLPSPLTPTRPLPLIETLAEEEPGHRLVFGQMSDVGKVRSNNQDAAYSMLSTSVTSLDLPEFGLFIVADGMGGHLDGEKASAITVQIIAQHVLSEIYISLLKQEMGDPDRPSIVEVLRTAAQRANEEILDHIQDAGTTVTMAVVLGNMAYLAHVGDSRAYLIANDEIELITRDHSLVQRLIEMEQLTVEQAARHPQRNVLYRAVGQDDAVEVDTLIRRMPPGSYLLLCSDGLWGVLPEDAILQVIANQAHPQHICEKLVSLAKDAGGPDNISVVLVQMP